MITVVIASVIIIAVMRRPFGRPTGCWERLVHVARLGALAISLGLQILQWLPGNLRYVFLTRVVSEELRDAILDGEDTVMDAILDKEQSFLDWVEDLSNPG